MLLQGLKVVELATWIAGPGCAAIMADWGAHVIKVEAAAGDPVRTMDVTDPRGNAIFNLENRGKRGVVLDLAQPAGRAQLMSLLAEADIFITNVRPGALARMKLDYETVHRECPRLIYASITGFGLTGPDSNLPAFDVTAFWTRSGIAASTIPPDQEPFLCRPGFGDHATALATLSGVLAALHERSSTGRGRLIESSLMRTATYMIGWDLSIQLKQGEVVTALPRADRPSALAGFFRTADERWLCIAPRGDACFHAVMRCIGKQEVSTDPAYALPLTDLEKVRTIRAMVDEAVGRLTLAQAAELLTAADVIWAPMATLRDFVTDPQANSAGCFVQLGEESAAFSSPAAPVRFPEGAPPVRRTGPALGQHNDEVFGPSGQVRWSSDPPA